tara:strand:+ start:460 stop:1065 length:606 start_codon:yes stop_codon:yes gene_type:complete
MQTRPITPELAKGSKIDSEVDPLGAPIPGQSLTDEPGRATIEQPPQDNDPEAVIADIKKFVSQPKVSEELIGQMASGFPVETLVNMFVKGGVAQGKFSVDVAEIIKPALAVMFMVMALDEGVSVIPFSDEPMQEEDVEGRVKRNMNNLDPELASEIRAGEGEARLAMLEEEITARTAARDKVNSMEQPVESDGSFLEMEGE